LTIWKQWVLISHDRTSHDLTIHNGSAGFVNHRSTYENLTLRVDLVARFPIMGTLRILHRHLLQLEILERDWRLADRRLNKLKVKLYFSTVSKANHVFVGEVKFEVVPHPGALPLDARWQ